MIDELTLHSQVGRDRDGLANAIGHLTRVLAFILSLDLVEDQGAIGLDGRSSIKACDLLDWTSIFIPPYGDIAWIGFAFAIHLSPLTLKHGHVLGSLGYHCSS